MRKENKGGLSTKDIKNQYNIYKQVMAQDLPKLCKKYRNNLKTIIVMMKRKTKQPKITLQDVINKIDEVDKRLSLKIDYLDKKLTCRIDNLVVKNNLTE